MHLSTVSLDQAQIHLPELIEKLQSGEEIVITRNETPVARLVSESKSDKPVRQLGTLKGTVLYMAPDFDTPLEQFKDYMK